MRLTREQVEKIATAVVAGLKDKGLITFKSGEHAVIEKIHHVVLENLRAEDDLDREVEEILKTHVEKGAVNAGKVDYRRIFNMVKAKLAKERGVVI